MAAPTDAAPRTQRTVSPAVVLYWGIFLAIGLSVSILGPALSDLRERSGSGIGSIGVLFVGQAAGYIVGSLVGGRLLDRFDGHRVCAAALVGVALGMFVLPELTGLGGLFAVFVLIGAGAAMVDVGANALLMWELGAAGGRAMNVLHLCFGLGALSAPLLVYLGLAAATWAAGIACLVLAALALRVTAPVARPVADHQDASPSPRLLVLLSSFFLLYLGVEVGFAGWVHTYGEEIGFTAAGATWLTSTYWIGFTAGRLASSAMAYRFQPKSVLIGASGLTVVVAAALVVGGGRAAPVWMATALLGVATAPQFPVMLNYLERRIHVTGYATSWFIGAAGIGGLVFPWAIGRWIDRSGAAALPWAMLLLSVATLASFARTNQRLGG